MNIRVGLVQVLEMNSSVSLGACVEEHVLDGGLAAGVEGGHGAVEEAWAGRGTSVNEVHNCLKILTPFVTDPLSGLKLCTLP